MNWYGYMPKSFIDLVASESVKIRPVFAREVFQVVALDKAKHFGYEMFQEQLIMGSRFFYDDAIVMKFASVINLRFKTRCRQAWDTRNESSYRKLMREIEAIYLENVVDLRKDIWAAFMEAASCDWHYSREKQYR